MPGNALPCPVYHRDGVRSCLAARQREPVHWIGEDEHGYHSLDPAPACMTTVFVRKHDWRGAFRYAWRGEVSRRTDRMLLLQAIWQGPGEPLVGTIRFEAGDRFLEYYYPGRPYAIWQIERPDGALKGWYCNVSTPPVERDGILRFDDLLLDVLVYPDGRYTVLDEDEFAAAHAEGMPEDRVALARAGLAALVGMIERGEAPFPFASGTARALHDGEA